MMAPQVLQLGLSPISYIDFIAEAVWKTLRSSVSSGCEEAGPPLLAKEGQTLGGQATGGGEVAGDSLLGWGAVGVLEGFAVELVSGGLREASGSFTGRRNAGGPSLRSG